ncbi:LysR family transcriptional regulator [Bradyrhizobium oligotrophicum]|uniref:LysR family transcriptional regulator n=1 Tax=Bradyrhizobium oligotrophicum TaxID=44255 RepID=UPI003EBB57FE
MDRFEAMRTLVAAVDGGSLSAASRALAVPLPTVSRWISDLEAHLGSRLLVRTSRKLVLTEAGEAFAAVARRLLDDLAEAERAASGEYREPRGELLVTAPIMFGKLHVAPLVHAFLAAYPPVSVRLILSDHVIDLVDAHVDVAVRIGRMPDSQLISRQVGHVRWILSASPDYLARRGEPADLEALRDHDCIAFEGLQTYRSWTFGSGAGERTVPIKPRFSVNTADAVVEAAAAGLGVARLMSYQVARAIADGRLVTILHQRDDRPTPVNLVHQPQPVQPLKRRAFLDFVAPRLSLALAKIEESLGKA